MPKGIVHCNKLEDRSFFKEEVVSMKTGNIFCSCILIFQFKILLIYNKRKMYRVEKKKTIKCKYRCCNYSFISGSMFKLEKIFLLFSCLYLCCKKSYLYGSCFVYFVSQCAWIKWTSQMVSVVSIFNTCSE